MNCGEIKDIIVDNLITVVNIFASVALVIATIYMARSSKKMSEKTLVKNYKSLLKIKKLKASDCSKRGSLVISKKKDKALIKEIGEFRFVLYAEDINDFNAARKLKVKSVEVYDSEEHDKKYNFKYKKNKGNTFFGYQKTEYLMWPVETKRLTTIKTKEEGKELEEINAIKNEKEDCYRIPLIFRFNYKEEKEDFIKYISENKFMFKIKIKIYSNMGVITSYLLTLVNRPLDDENVAENEWSYINDMKIKIKNIR